MIVIEPTTDFSELRKGPRERAEESVKVWRVRYGDDNDSPDHTLIYFGIISTNAICAQGVIWAQPAAALFEAPLGVRKEAATAWRSFSALRPWQLLAFCDRDSRVNARFLQFLGFAPYTADAEYEYFQGQF